MRPKIDQPGHATPIILISLVSQIATGSLLHHDQCPNLPPGQLGAPKTTTCPLLGLLGILPEIPSPLIKLVLTPLTASPPTPAPTPRISPTSSPPPPPPPFATATAPQSSPHLPPSQISCPSPPSTTALYLCPFENEQGHSVRHTKSSQPRPKD